MKNASENDEMYRERGFYDHGQYPFVFDVQFVEADSPAGFGYIDVCKKPQMYIDRLNSVILKSALMSARPRFFIRSDGAVNESEYADWTQPFVHTNGNLGADSIAPIHAASLDGTYVALLQNKRRKEIGLDMNVTEHTIKKHTGNIFSKLGVSSRAELFALADR